MLRAQHRETVAGQPVSVPRPANSPPGLLLGLQATLGNAAVAHLVVQRRVPTNLPQIPTGPAVPITNPFPKPIGASGFGWLKFKRYALYASPCPDCHDQAKDGVFVTEELFHRWMRDRPVKDLLNERNLLNLQLDPHGETKLLESALRDLRALVLRSDEFDGSPLERRQADAFLIQHFPRDELQVTLERWFLKKYEIAAGRTPKNAVLEEDEELLQNVVAGKYGGSFVTDRFETPVKRDANFGSYWISDVDLEKKRLWLRIEGQQMWFYRISIDAFNAKDPDLIKVAGIVAKNARFAGELFPWMIKLGGLALGAKTRLAHAIVGVALGELGEEGVRYVRRHPQRSFAEILKSFGKELAMDRVLNRLTATPTGRATAGAGTVGTIEDKAVGLIRQHLFLADEKKLVRVIRSGGTRRVDNKALRDEGFILEAPVRAGGEVHTYRLHASGNWCRFVPKACPGFMGDEVEAALKTPKQAEMDRLTEVSEQLEADKVVLADLRARFAALPGKTPINLKTLTQREIDALKDHVDDINSLTKADIVRARGKADAEAAAQHAQIDLRQAALVLEIAEENVPLYMKMRRATTAKLIREVRSQARNRDGVTNAAPKSGELQVDHVVSVSELVYATPKFLNLSSANKVAIMNDRKNLLAIDRKANGSRSDRAWSQWPQASKHYSAEQIRRMVARENEIREHLHHEIDRLFAAQGGKQVPPRAK